MVGVDKKVRGEDPFCYVWQKSIFRKLINCDFPTSHWTKSLWKHPRLHLKVKCSSFEREKLFWWMSWDEVFCVVRSFTSGSCIFQGIWTHFLMCFAQILHTSIENVNSLARRDNGVDFNQIDLWVRPWSLAFLTSNNWRNFVDNNVTKIYCFLRNMYSLF